MINHHIYWWNLENLFDIENSATRPEWLQRRLRRELTGWTEDILDRKISNICDVIAQFNGGDGPDILGVCEIENEAVMARLKTELDHRLSRSYKVLHKDTGDKRGIDIAFLYDEAKYRDDERIFTLEIMKRHATRDLLQVNLTTIDTNQELILIGNHWPSRMGGQYESEPYRMMVGEILSYWIDRIHEIKGKDTAIVVMGDFNDQPYDRSIAQYLGATNNRKRIENARNNYLFNPMYPFLDGKLGTHVYGNEISLLDQFMLSRGITLGGNDRPFSVEEVSIIKLDGMTKGEYNTPIRFGRPSSQLNLDGYSDHLPIKLVLKED